MHTTTNYRHIPPGSEPNSTACGRNALAWLPKSEDQRAVTSDTGSLEAEDRVLGEQMMTFGGTPDDAALLIDYSRAHSRTDVLSMSFDQLHSAVLADEGVKNVGAAVVTSFGPHIAQTEGLNPRGAWRRVKEFASSAIDAYNQSWLSSEVGAVGPRVRNRPGASVKPLKPIVLGETMDTRVEPVADASNGQTFQPRSRSADRNVWNRNQRRWIRSTIQAGRQTRCRHRSGSLRSK
ncbi:MAG: hypothetical protein QOC81_3341 [Thermoanaerobaculia bacterium]|jgi:hypothetical protein|nr:hypothetical protein [Thermoanaerobaculia bacterium]